MPAINPVKLLTAANATATNNSTTINITGDVDASRIFQGSVISIGGFTPVEALSGTLADGSGNSTITLRDPWPETTTTGRLTAFNTIEGLTGAIEKARQVVEQTSGVEEVSGTGLLEKTGDNTYDVANFSTQGRNLVGGVDAAAQRSTLGLGTAATKDIQSSPTDTTAGRLMPVGAFGLGNLAGASVVPLGDIDSTVIPSGVYRVYAADLGTKPYAADDQFVLQNWRYNSGEAVQIAHFVSGVIWQRGFSGGQWQPWAEFYHSGNSVNPLDFGIGVDTLNATSSTDLNLPPYTDVGMTTVSAPISTLTNKPVDPQTADRYVCEMRGDTSNGVQRITNRGSGITYQRNWDIGTPSDWYEQYHSGNSVNPLDFGIGGIASVIPSNDFLNLPDGGGIFASDGALTNGPTATGNYMTLSMVRSDTGDNFNGFGSLLSIHRDNGSAYVGGMNETNNPEIKWHELYHSGNSVNPLDYGIGTNSAPALADLGSDIRGITKSGLYRVTSVSDSNIPVGTNSRASIFSSFSNVDTGSFIVKNNNGDEFWSQSYRDGVYRNWVEHYHSGNTNFNEFGGVAATDDIAVGFAVTSTTMRFFLPINSASAPTSITIEPLSTFSVGAETGIDSARIGLSGVSSNKLAALTVTGFTGLVEGQSETLRTETATSKITVNF